MLKNKLREIKKGVVHKFDIAPEAAGCVRLILIDNSHACIENHKGVMEYNQKKVCINAGGLSIAISGSSLVLEHFDSENAVVCGEIKAIQYESLQQ